MGRRITGDIILTPHVGIESYCRDIYKYNMTFTCQNCKKLTTINGERPLKFCKRTACIQDRWRKQNRFSPIQKYPSFRTIKSGIACQKCGEDTGPNRHTCPKCLRELSHSIGVMIWNQRKELKFIIVVSLYLVEICVNTGKAWIKQMFTKYRYYETCVPIKEK